MGAIKASEGGGGGYATSCQSGLMSRAIRGNRTHGGSVEIALARAGVLLV